MGRPRELQDRKRQRGPSQACIPWPSCSRAYKVATPWGSDRSAKSLLSLAFNPFNHTCDVIVATVVAGDEPVAQEQAVLEFLDGDLVRHYAEELLGAVPAPVSE